MPADEARREHRDEGWREHRGVARRVAVVQRWLTSIYRLDLCLDVARLVMPSEQARALLPDGGPP